MNAASSNGNGSAARAGQNGKRPNNQRRKHQNRPKPVDIWKKPPPLPPVEPVVVANEVGALLRSLGDPPMTGGTAAGHYFIAVAERAAFVARALAAMTPGLLADESAD